MIRTELLLQWSSIIFTGLAAAFWFVSAVVKIPVRYDLGGRFFLSSSEPQKKQELDPLVKAMKKQAQWNAAGAICACIAFTLQAALALLGQG